MIVIFTFTEVTLKISEMNAGKFVSACEIVEMCLKSKNAFYRQQLLHSLGESETLGTMGIYMVDLMSPFLQ